MGLIARAAATPRLRMARASDFGIRNCRWRVCVHMRSPRDVTSTATTMPWQLQRSAAMGSAAPLPGVTGPTAAPAAPAGGSAAASTSTEPGGAKAPGEKKDGDQYVPLSWTSIFLRIGSAISSVFVAYHFYSANYSIHKTEISLLQSFRKLPLYWPAGPPEAVRNTYIDPNGLPDDIFASFCEWFVTTDKHEPRGLTRDDILELMTELGFKEEDPPCQEFLSRGDAQLEEKRRLMGAGLQESVNLLARLAREPPKKPKDGEARRQPADSEILAGIKRKHAGVSSVLGGASVLQQAMVAPAPAQPQLSVVPEANVSAPDDVKMPWPPLDEDDEGIDEAQQRELEDGRLARIEADLFARLERLGSLSPAEEARLRDVQAKRSANR